MRITMKLLALILVCLAEASVHAETERNPFELPASAENPYRYEKAVQQVTVKGIVRAEGVNRVIIGIKDIEGLAVLKSGDKIALDYQGLGHRFTVGEIRTKSVRFQARPAPEVPEGKKAPEALTYEVLIQ